MPIRLRWRTSLPGSGYHIFNPVSEGWEDISREEVKSLVDTGQIIFWNPNE